VGITDKIKNKALKIGFNLIGICEPKPLTNAYNILQKRKNNNKLPDMVTENIKLLTTPEMHLKSVNSIISLALSYASDIKDSKKEFKIAKYARGKDYHKVMRKKMEKLKNYIKKIDENADIIFYSDTAPIVEKEIARKAGLGWIGKNNLLINPTYGSYLVLGEILTSLKLDYDKPHKDGCGECRICINKCPTGALKRPYYLDTSLCISFLTQKKGDLRRAERLAIGNSLWGCDICQLNCPYNKNIALKTETEFNPCLDDNLIDIINFNRFPREWKESAINWRGLETIKRNAIIVMANSGKKKYLNYLQNNNINKSNLIKKYVNWAIKVLRRKQDD